MTARLDVPVADAALAAVDGARRGERLVRRLRDGFALTSDDVLHELLEVVEADGDRLTATPRLRAFARALGKAIEGGTTR